MGKQKLYITTTIPESLGFFCGQIQYLSSEFNITVVSSPGVRLKTFGDKNLYVSWVALPRLYRVDKKIADKYGTHLVFMRH